VPDIVLPEDLQAKQIFLILSAPGNIRECNIEIIKELSTRGYHSLVITTNFPYTILKKLYGESGVDLSGVYFVDAVTHHTIGSAENIPGVVRNVNNPTNLTGMGIAVTEMLNEHKDEKICILFDSISTLLVYLPSTDISKFIHFVTNKLRLMDISGVFLAVEKGLDPMLMTQVVTFVDKVVDTG